MDHQGFLMLNKIIIIIKKKKTHIAHCNILPSLKSRFFVVLELMKNSDFSSARFIYFAFILVKFVHIISPSTLTNDKHTSMWAVTRNHLALFKICFPVPSSKTLPVPAL